ncbi:protein TolQ [Comamonas aquatica]|uniref:Tol-Pal system protein TolQ n=1 Tax=Comamonas aquatica TaxID=225991 RepID=A0AA43AWD6_9BURK|nr:protein TolQ [Comamonas aquatica]MDH0201628.1 protein TolQ [Comamonas aquatica]MDH0362658.1 protein TolQ [Comamonas aquatica]MDH0371338.1 protein TolQ [Comamonas aquatica]MDH0381212.1 protein TolQ [Comamonas aquatica]MDH0428847.1 protein TolQ [Comamonas aquatica]
MNAAQDMSILSLIIQASWVVQLVMLILVVASVASWATIFRKAQALKQVRQLNDAFEQDFWSGQSLNDLYNSATQNAKSGGPMERIFASGMREYKKLRERRINDSGTLMDGTRRAMRASLQREMDEVESGLAFLGTVGSVSPYVGLFGTVWGVMHAFTGFASMEQITLATVAPGIAEALVATAMGLFAAIPAVTAYNRYAHNIDRIANVHETFIEEFSNILQRNVSGPTASSTASGY